MGSVIWKEILQLTGLQEIMIPAGAEILCAREQFNEVCVWFRCNPNVPKSPRKIAIVGTGHPAPDDEGRYLGTASLQGGRLIFHVFEQRAST